MLNGSLFICMGTRTSTPVFTEDNSEMQVTLAPPQDIESHSLAITTTIMATNQLQLVISACLYRIALTLPSVQLLLACCHQKLVDTEKCTIRYR